MVCGQLGFCEKAGYMRGEDVDFREKEDTLDRVVLRGKTKERGQLGGR